MDKSKRSRSQVAKLVDESEHTKSEVDGVKLVLAPLVSLLIGRTTMRFLGFWGTLQPVACPAFLRVLLIVQCAAYKS